MAKKRSSKVIGAETHRLGSAAAGTVSGAMLGKIASIIILGLSFIVVTRLLGPAQYGIYALALAAATIAGTLGSPGVGTAMNKYIPEYVQKKDKRAIEDIIGNSLFITLVLGAAFTIGTILLSGFLSVYFFHNGSYAFLIDVAALTLIPTMLFGNYYCALLGFNMGKQIAAMTTIQAVLQGVLSIVFILLGFGPAGPLMGMTFGYAAAFFYTIYPVYHINKIRMFILPSFVSIKKLLSFSFYLTGTGVGLSIVPNLAFILLSGYATTAVIGNLGVAAKINSLLDIVSGSVIVSLITLYSALASSRMRSKIAEFYAHTVYYSLVLLAPILLFIVVLAQPFSYVAFSGAYKLAPLFIAIMGIGALLAISGQYADTLLKSVGRVKDVAKYNIILTAVELVLIPVLIPTLKGIGYVLLLFIIVPIVSNVLFIGRTAKLYGLGLEMNKLGRIAAANAVSILLIVPLILIWQSNYIPLLITAALEMIIIYPIMLGLIRGVDRRDIKILGTLTNSIPVVGQVFGALLRYASFFIR